MRDLHSVAISIGIAFLLVISTLTAAAEQRTGPYLVAVIPAAPPVTMHRLWTPFLERLSRDTGLEFHLKVYEKMSAFEQDISAGVPDLLFINPLQAVVAHEAQGYVPLVRSSRLVSAELFVHRDSAIMSVDDLAGKKIALIGNKNL